MSQNGSLKQYLVLNSQKTRSLAMYRKEISRKKFLERKKLAPVIDIENAYFCKLVFIGVLNVCPNPYFIHCFPIFATSFLTVLKMMLPLLSGKKSCHQNPYQYHFSFSKYTRSNTAKANKILGKLSIIF